MWHDSCTRDMTRAYVTWLVYISRDMTTRHHDQQHDTFSHKMSHSYLTSFVHTWHDSYLTCFIHTWHDSFIRDMTHHSYLTCLNWNLVFGPNVYRTCDMTHLYLTRLIYMWHDSSLRHDTGHETWLHDTMINNTTHSHVTWLMHDSFSSCSHHCNLPFGPNAYRACPCCTTSWWAGRVVWTHSPVSDMTRLDLYVWRAAW